MAIRVPWKQIFKAGAKVPSGATLELLSGSTLSIAGTLTATGKVEAAHLASDAVETAKIKDANVTTAKIADANVTEGKIGAAAVTSAKLHEGLLRYAAVEISSAEILALFTTPKSLVAAPGAGRSLELVSLLLALDYATTAYTIGTAGDIQVKYTDGSGVAVSTTRAATGFLDQAADTLSLLDKLGATVVPAVNAALVLTLATANVTAGDSPIHAKVVYRVHATGL